MCHWLSLIGADNGAETAEPSGLRIEKLAPGEPSPPSCRSEYGSSSHVRPSVQRPAITLELGGTTLVRTHAIRVTRWRLLPGPVIRLLLLLSSDR